MQQLCSSAFSVIRLSPNFHVYLWVGPWHLSSSPRSLIQQYAKVQIIPGRRRGILHPSPFKEKTTSSVFLVSSTKTFILLWGHLFLLFLVRISLLVLLFWSLWVRRTCKNRVYPNFLNKSQFIIKWNEQAPFFFSIITTT